MIDVYGIFLWDCEKNENKQKDSVNGPFRKVQINLTGWSNGTFKRKRRDRDFCKSFKFNSFSLVDMGQIKNRTRKGEREERRSRSVAEREMYLKI